MWLLNSKDYILEPVLVIKNTYSHQEIETIKQLSDRFPEKNGVTKNSESSQQDLNIRNSVVKWLVPHESTEWLYRKQTDIVQSLNDNYGFNLTFLENIQYTKYTGSGTLPGRYVAHQDESDLSNNKNSIRKLSLVTLLSDPSDYKGGEFLIYFGGAPETYIIEKGDTIAFPSFMLHEVAPVIKGERISMVNWVQGPKWV